MATDEVKITELGTLATVANDDWVPVVDISDTTDGPGGTTKKAARSEFKGDTGDTGATGATGAAGADGDDAYVYIAYASDASGTGFTTTFNASLDYIAIKTTTTEIASPSASDFTGLWKNYKGATGATGATGAQGPQGDPGDGDMNASIYDPQNIADDAFDTDNHTDGSTNKVYSATEKTKLAGVEASADVTDAVNIASSIVGVADKATPIDADSIPLIDSAASNALKELTWANIKATLKTYFDTLYAAALGADDNYVTDAEKTVIGNTSGTNTGDEPSASTTAQGIVELATTAEAETGTDATRAVTPDALHDMTTLAGAAWMLDEDNMASNSAVKVPSQQSVKAYVDASAGGGGAWTLKSYSTASATSITVSTLDMATDNNHYLIIVDMNHGGTVDRVSMQAVIDGVTTTDTYASVWTGRAYDWSAGTGAASDNHLKGSQWKFGGQAGNSGHLVLNLFITENESNGSRVTGSFKTVVNSQAAGEDDFAHYEGAVFQTSATNVTSIKFQHDGAQSKDWRVWILYPAIA